MRRNPWKWLLLGGALTFIVLFGLEMSNTGIERIYGPIEGEEMIEIAPEDSTYESDTERRIAELEEELKQIRQIAYEDESNLETDHPRLPGIPYEENDAAVNKIADSTSGLLQSASSSGIRFVGSLFEGLFH
ncbi:translation initiation factor 2 [Paenibacillus sp. L3-i20]|uniref:translation initiation factor 2 n=1 Tax=Paenibacillus sp. L3-i20 TaxID=2905833 RepID=UPI001EDE072B|nr:translation initiation factor 2 [Paenibacillus sp. L3-i20]GKU79742.1 hypothetical protein L3i20_v241390 [Paenibacillus sp. L3-i20]